MRTGYTLLEVIVTLAVLAIVAALPVLGATRKATVISPTTVLRECQRRAIESRENSVVHRDNHYVVCRPDGRIVGDELDSLTFAF